MAGQVEGALIEVGLLGSLRLVVDGLRLGPSDFGGRKPKQLVEILLVHQGEAVAKERIVDLLWPERLPRDPMRTLEAYVSGVRRRLHGDVAVAARHVLRSEPGAYRFVLDNAIVDTRLFDGLSNRAAAAPPIESAAIRDAALALVRGELLADEPYADWAMPLRDLYRERHIEMLLDAANDHLVAGHHDLALDRSERALLLQPWRERAHRTVMAAHYAGADQAAALRAYDRCRRALADELGVDPLPETERVYLGILNQEPPSRLVEARSPARLAERPVTRYARSGDTAIAYQTVGHGRPDIVFAPGWFSHVEVGWEEPRYAEFLQRLARERRLLLFDKRGVGMSDPAEVSASIDERADDIVAVMDAVGSERAVIFGVSEGGPMGVSVAARHPRRVAGLVLYSSFGRLTAADDYPFGWSEEFLELYQSSLEQAWTAGHLVELVCPVAGDDVAVREWISRYLRLSASPATARKMLAFAADADVRDLLPLVSVPTLVLHRRDEQWVTPENGRFVADHIRGARFVELPGVDHWPWFGDADAVLREVDAFIEGLAG